MDETVAVNQPRASVPEPVVGASVEGPAAARQRRPVWNVLVRILAVLALLYVFLLSIGFIEVGFKTAGRPLAEGLIRSTTNPFVGLFIGILATSLIQSSSTTTSIIVGLVAADALTLRNAVPFIMGANIGTTVTATLVSMGSVTRKVEFRRAFAAATVHDFFNVLSVAILLPLELRFHFLEGLAVWIAHHLLGIEGTTFDSPVKAILKPVTEAYKELLLNGWALSKGWVVGLLVGTGLLGLFISLIFLSRTLRMVMAGTSENAIRKIVGLNPYTALMIGAALTVSVQSSSITTSVFVPLVGTGILTLEQVYPLTLGANIGTTVTALLASMVGNMAAIAIALTHLCFNLAGTLIFLPIPFMRWPIWLARHFSDWTSERRPMALVFILVAFFGIPGLLIWLTR